MHTFEFDGKKLSDIGAIITEKPHYVLSVKELDFTALPGKSGDIVTDKKRFKNINISYKISSVPTFGSYSGSEQDFVDILSEWLLTSYSYKVLRDTYNVGYFRKAVCTNISDPVVDARGVVSATVTFNCDPFRYSDSGLFPVTFQADPEQPSQDFTLINPEMWSAEPVIKFTGAGPVDVIINDSALQFTITAANSIIVDKPNENIYYDDVLKTPCNDIVECDRLPTLRPGANQILILNTSDNDFIMEITPNWGRL